MLPTDGRTDRHTDKLRDLGKPQKKSSTNGQAIKRGGGGRAIKEKRTFFETFFFILLPFRNINILL